MLWYACRLQDTNKYGTWKYISLGDTKLLSFYIFITFFRLRICSRRSLVSEHYNNAQERIDDDERPISFALVVRESGGLNVKDGHRHPAKVLTPAQRAEIMDSRVCFSNYLGTFS